MKLTRRMVATGLAALMMTGVAVAVSPGAFAADGADRSQAKKVLVQQGMPADVAEQVTSVPKADFKVKGKEVYVDGTSVSSITEALAAQFTVAPGTQGSDYWWGVAVNSVGSARTVLYFRSSWSFMWTMKLNMTDVRDLQAAACAFAIPIGPVAAGVCAAVVQAFFMTMKAYINSGISKKLCLQVRMAVPTDLSMTRFSLVKCRV